MSTTLESRLETTGPINLKVELLVGDVTLTAGDAPTTTVRLHPHGKNGAELAEKFTVEAHGNDVVVLSPKIRDSFFGLGTKGSVDVEVELPSGSTVDVRTGSGDVGATGLLDDVRATTGAGDLAFHEVGTAQLKSGSGDITLQSTRGDASAKTGSGDISVGSAGGRLDLVSGSGDIELRRSDAAVKARTGSGDLHIGASTGDLELVTGTGDVDLRAVHGGQVRTKTGTGDVSIAVAAGVAAYLDLNTVTGDVDIDLEQTSGPGDAEAQAMLVVQSGSGDIRVKRAQVSLA
ncbi:MAG TPA: DUF4097 family beta strand repeat-containing protein [Phycicoccus sp.]|nr:DUF4097 family beta strand repeat-containing protein [Phycicoccus sp.]HET9632823.1 DUF4097 family beta strand repeat-containing protein [Terrabacter sp.]